MGDAFLNGNVVLNGAQKTFSSQAGNLNFGNSSGDVLTINGTSTLRSDTQTVNTPATIVLNADLGINAETGLLSAISGRSSYLDLYLNSVSLGGGISLGSGILSLAPRDGVMPLYVGEVNPLGLNLSNAQLALISTTGGLRLGELKYGTDADGLLRTPYGGDIFIDNVQAGNLTTISGPVQLVTHSPDPNFPAAVVIKSPSVLPKFAMDADEILGLPNLTFSELSGLKLTYASSDFDVTAPGAVTITGSVDVRNNTLGSPFQPKFSVTSPGGISATAAIRAQNGVTLQGATVTTAEVRGGAGAVLLQTSGGTVTINGGIQSEEGVTIDPGGGYFVNNAGGNPFDASTLNSVNGVRASTRDMFSSNLGTAFANGLQVVFGTGSPGRNQLLSDANFTDGNFAPLYFEFSTGTAQPYILAQQTAIPGIRIPAAINFSGGLATPTRYTEEELEMLTPQERSAYEARQRQRLAKVSIENEAGAGELGRQPTAMPPQASQGKPEEAGARQPTAQVLLQGVPLARSGTAVDRNDTTRLLRGSPSKIFALRPESPRMDDLIMGERMAAEIVYPAGPVALQR